MGKLTDEEIIALYLGRKEQAIQETEKKYKGYCFQIADNILQNHEDAEECVNDTWFSAWSAIPPMVPECLRLYLARLVRNHSLNRYKAKRAKKRGKGEITVVLDELGECIAGESDVEADFIAGELKDSINGFVAALPEREANLFVRRYFFTEPFSAIASRYGMSVGYVRVTLTRIRKKLKKHLEQEGYID